MTNETADGTVYWVTGLAGSGKTSLGRLLRSRLHDRGTPAILLDGDAMRQVFGDTFGFAPADRRQLAMTYARMSLMLARQGFDVVCATVSMFQDVRDWNRQNIPSYCEIYLKVPMEVLRERDPKGLYSGAMRGELTDVMGVDLPVDEPRAPDFVLDHHGEVTPEVAVETLMRKLDPWRRDAH